MIQGVHSRDEPAEMVFRDPVMQAFMHHVEQVAQTSAAVLITGESGTGKELIAGRLHHGSDRQGGPFVVFDCAAVPDGMMESELFGHESGAFPGATSRRIGKFQAADGGTLLLDEIGALDQRIQAKVLRALEQQAIDRVGGEQPVRVDVRVVATTTRDLQKEVRLGRFRSDLLLRINIISLVVPPLRERLGDLPALADLFVCRFARMHGRPAAALSPEALNLLARHSWPGNVRELENVLHRAVLKGTHAVILPSMLDIERADQDDDPDPAPLAAAVEAAASTPTAGKTIEAVEKEMILETLYERKGNRSQTAAVLGISIRTLRNKLNEYERSGTPIPRPVVIGAA